MTFEVRRLVRWNKNMFFQIYHKLGTYLLFHHFGNVPYYRNRSIIRHNSHFSIVLINRSNPGKFPVIWKGTIWKGIVYDTQQGGNQQYVRQQFLQASDQILRCPFLSCQITIPKVLRDQCEGMPEYKSKHKTSTEKCHPILQKWLFLKKWWSIFPIPHLKIYQSGNI